MATPTLPRRQAQKFPSRSALRELKLEALYECAARAFTEKGFHGTSLEDVAAGLGVSKPALYRYVPNKQALLYRLHCLSLDTVEAALAQAEDSPGDGIERLRLALYLYVRRLTTASAACLVLMEEGAMKGDENEAILTRRRAFEARLRAMVSAGIEDGSIAACDPKLAVMAVMGAVNWVSRWYRPEGGRSGDEIAQAMSRQLARGLAADPARFPLSE